MNKLLFSLMRRFSSTCNQVRDTARLLRLDVKSRSAVGFCHIPNVWLRNPETWKPLNQLSPGVPPPAWGRTSAAAPVTLRVLPEDAERSAAVAREPDDKTNAKATSTAAIASPPRRATPTAATLVPMSLLLLSRKF